MYIVAFVGVDGRRSTKHALSSSALQNRHGDQRGTDRERSPPVRGALPGRPDSLHLFRRIQASSLRVCHRNVMGRFMAFLAASKRDEGSHRAQAERGGGGEGGHLLRGSGPVPVQAPEDEAGDAGDSAHGRLLSPCHVNVTLAIVMSWARLVLPAPLLCAFRDPHAISRSHSARL